MKKWHKKLLNGVCIAIALAMVITNLTTATVFATDKTITVKTQVSLLKALNKVKTGKCSKITIAGSAKKFSIPVGAYQCTLTVKNKNAEITNKASFQKVNIISAKVFTEKGSGNTFNISGKNTKLVAGKNSYIMSVKVSGSASGVTISNKSRIEKISVANAGSTTISGKAKQENVVTVNNSEAVVTIKSSADVTVNKAKSITVGKGGTINKMQCSGGCNVVCNTGGSISELSLKSKGKYTVRGKGSVSKIMCVAAVETVVSLANCKPTLWLMSKGASITAGTEVTVKCAANGAVVLTDAAEGSVIEGTTDGVSVSVNNKTKGNVTIRDVSGASKVVPAGEKSNVNVAAKKMEGSGDLGLKSAEMGVDEKTLIVKMNKISGIKESDFIIDKDIVPIKITYASSIPGYTLEFATDLKEAVEHTVTVSVDGYKTAKATFKFDWTPVIIAPAKTMVDVYVSEAMKFKPAELSVKIPGSAVNATAVKKMYKSVDMKTEVNNSAAMTWLAVEGNAICVVYSYSNNGHAAKEVLITYTAIADKAASKIIVEGDKTVGAILTAKSDAGGSVTYQWQIGSSNDSISFQNISKATSATYKVLPEDYNKFIRVLVTVGGNTTTGQKASEGFKIAAGTLTMRSGPDAITVTNGTKLADGYKFTGFNFVDSSGAEANKGTFAWASTSKGLTVVASMKGQLNYTLSGYNTVACTVDINVIGAKPSDSELKAITFVSPATVEEGYFVFAANNSIFEYRLDNGPWTAITSTPIAYGSASTIYFRRAGVTNSTGTVGPSDVANYSVAISSVAGTLLPRRSPVSISVKELLPDTNTLSFELIDNNNSLGTIYNFYVYSSTGDLVGSSIGKIAKTSNTIIDSVILTLANGQMILPGNYYYVSVIASGDNVKFRDSAESSRCTILARRGIAGELKLGGTIVPGYELTAEFIPVEAMEGVVYTWYRSSDNMLSADDTLIVEASGIGKNVYTLTDSDIGFWIACEVTHPDYSESIVVILDDPIESGFSGAITE